MYREMPREPRRVYKLPVPLYSASTRARRRKDTLSKLKLGNITGPGITELPPTGRLPTFRTRPKQNAQTGVTSPAAPMSFETPFPPYNASDPYATFLNASCLDLLLIEIVPMAHRLASELSVPSEDGEGSVVDEEEQREAAFRRLESLGYRVGQGLAER